MGKHCLEGFVCFLKSFFLRVRRSVAPLFCALSLLFNADCGLSASDLQYSHPTIEIVQICDKPLDVPDDVNLWGYDFTLKRLVTAEVPIELRLFRSADAFFEYNPDAPASSASRMPPEYGLTCAKRGISFPDATAKFFPPSSDLFRSKEPCPAQVADTVGHANSRWFAQNTGRKPPCDPPAKKKAPKRVHVCVRPPGIGDKVDEWTSRDVKGNLLTNSDKVFADAAANAEFIFVFDTTAHPQSVCWFKDPEKLSCPGKHVPKVCNQAVLSELLFAESANSYRDAVSAKPKKGDGQTTETSSSNGHGPPLSFLEMLTRNMSIAGALASGDTSGSLKDPNGSRYGIPGGKNVGGPDLQILQAASGPFAIIRNPFKTGKDFIDTVGTALRGRKVAGILDPKVLSKEIAEKLAKEPTEKELKEALAALKRGEEISLESFGKSMAVSLREAGVIMPYSRAQIFTAGWGGKYQAHHALEVAMAKKTLKMDAKAIADIPAIILTEAEHTFITGELTKARNELLNNLKKTGRKMEPADLWQMYQKVYKDKPAWLEAIKGYFPNVP